MVLLCYSITVDFQKKLTSQFGPNFFVCCRFHFIFGDCSGGVCSVLWHVFYLLEVFCAPYRSIWVYATTKKYRLICMCRHGRALNGFGCRRRFCAVLRVLLTIWHPSDYFPINLLTRKTVWMPECCLCCRKPSKRENRQISIRSVISVFRAQYYMGVLEILRRCVVQSTSNSYFKCSWYVLRPY